MTLAMYPCKKKKRLLREWFCKVMVSPLPVCNCLFMKLIFRFCGILGPTEMQLVMFSTRIDANARGTIFARHLQLLQIKPSSLAFHPSLCLSVLLSISAFEIFPPSLFSPFPPFQTPTAAAFGTCRVVCSSSAPRGWKPCETDQSLRGPREEGKVKS